MPYIDPSSPHAGSAEVLFTGNFDEPTGTIAVSMKRGLIGSAGITGGTTGQINARVIPLAAGMVITNLAIRTGNTAAVTPSHFWLGLADVNMNILGVTADQGAAAIGTSTEFLFPIVGGPVLIPQTGPYYLLCSISAVTMPTFLGGSNLPGMAGGAPALCGQGATSATPLAVGANAGPLAQASNANIYCRVS